MKFVNVIKYLQRDNVYNQELMQKEVKGLCFDSRKCSKGFIFFAIKGYKTDGHDYIQSAVDNGVEIIFADSEYKERFSGRSFYEKIIFVKNTRQSLALCAKAFYNNPSGELKVIGVTGTNGKTSITYMLKSVLEQSGEKCGIIGTIAYFLGEKKLKAPNTTPESLEIYKLMRDMINAGCTYCIMEVSSHALFLNRAAGIDFDAAIFTNLSEDHLDFHKDFDDYLNAKLMLFDLLKKSQKQGKLVVINADSNVYNKVQSHVNGLGLNSTTISIQNNSDYKVTDYHSDIKSNKFSAATPIGNREFSLSLLGKFNVLNALCVIAVLDFFKIERSFIKKGLEQVNVPGRFQRIDAPSGFTVIVDYAHTNDALENVLSTIKELNPTKIISVFGCGGDRDTVKRGLMGEVSTMIADLTILTSDNPRTEDPEEILDMIEHGAVKGGGEFIRISDRESAIRRGIELAGAGDIVLIAGKGHEDYQLLGDKTIHFDDVEIAEKYVY